MSVVIDLNLVCLVCLRKASEYRSVFDTDEQTPQMLILDKITTCCSELDFQLDGVKLPDKICEQCLSDLTASWRFRQNCKEANTVFQYIQQRDEDAEVVATLELEQQQIKLPLGLKIKKMHTETPLARNMQPKTHKYNQHSSKNVIVQDDTELDLEYIQEEQLRQTPMQMMLRAEAVNQAETEAPDVVRESTEEEVDEDEADDDIYMPEEKVDDSDYSAEDSNHLEQMVNANKLKKAKRYKMHNTKEEHNTKAANAPKRGRGRPKKSTLGSLQPTMQIDQEQSADLKPMDSELFVKLEQPDESMPQNVDRRLGMAKSALAAAKSSNVSAALQLANKAETTKTTTHGRRRRNMPPELRSPKICEICGNSYKYQHALDAHMRRHNNVRPYACEFCDKSFVACVELQRHMRVHTGHKPYACQYCERRFSDFGSRIKHERTHTGERPYRCSTCNKSFAYAHVLSVHLRTHTGEKRFQCQRCGKGFTKKAYLLAHQGQHTRTPCGDMDAHTNLLELKTAEEQEECIFTAEYIVETVNEHEELAIKEEKLNMHFEYEEEGVEEEVAVAADETDDDQLVSMGDGDLEVDPDQMAEEHLEDVEDGDILFEIR